MHGADAVFPGILAIVLPLAALGYRRRQSVQFFCELIYVPRQPAMLAPVPTQADDLGACYRSEKDGHLRVAANLYGRGAGLQPMRLAQFLARHLKEVQLM